MPNPRVDVVLEIQVIGRAVWSRSFMGADPVPDSLLLDDLGETAAAGDAVLVVGAGVSIGATRGEGVVSWLGLLRQRSRSGTGLPSRSIHSLRRGSQPILPFPARLQSSSKSR